jgi:hypothetical protein
MGVATLKERFWAKVQKTDGCWWWTAGKFKNGYGSIYGGEHRGHYRKAHRVSWEIHYGAIPDNLCVLHKCDNPPCVRPDHLFLGTQKDNVQDMFFKERDNHAQGEHVNTAKLTTAQVVEIRERYIPRKLSMKRLSREYGVGKSTIFCILKGISWEHVQEAL